MTAIPTEEELAAERMVRREGTALALQMAVTILRSAETVTSSWADSISQVIERERGIGPGDEDQAVRVDDPEYGAALELYGQVCDARREIDKILLDLLALACPVCSSKPLGPDQACGRCGRGRVGRPLRRRARTRG